MQSRLRRLEREGIAPDQAAMLAFYEERKAGDDHGNP